MKPLGEIVKILKGGKAPEVFDEPRPGAYPYLQIEDLRPDATPKYAIDKDGTLATKADVLIAWDGANAGTAGFDLEGYIGSTIAILRPTHDDIHAPYLGYFLRSKFNEIQENTTGATIPHINRGYLESLRLPLPPLPEQRRIADLLARADRLRRLRRVGDTLSASLLQSVFLEMFGDLQSNEKGWDVATLEDLETEFIYGTSQKCFAEPKGYPVLRIPNVLHGNIDLEDLKYTEVPSKEAKNILLKGGDILFVRTNGNPDYVGRCAVFSLEKDFLFASYLIRARLDLTKINPVFLLSFLQSPGGREAMFPYIRTTAGQSNIGIEGLGQIPVPIPSPPEQERFAAVVWRVESLRGRQAESARQGEGLFQSLLHEAFNG